MAKNIIFLGRTGVGKSSLSTMFYQGYIKDNNNPFDISDGARGCTLDCDVKITAEWQIYDTIGLGEPDCGTVPHSEAKERIIKFLKDIKVPFNYICIVKKKGKLDTLDPIIYEATKEIFKGRTLRNIVLIITDANDSWLTKQKNNLVNIYGSVPMCAVNFPPVDSDVNLEQIYKGMRTNSLSELKVFLNSLNYPARMSDLCSYSDKQIESLADQIYYWFKQIVSLVAIAADICSIASNSGAGGCVIL